jgi:hypothetical protein
MGRSLSLLLLLLLTSMVIAFAGDDPPVEDDVIGVRRGPEGTGLFGPIDGVWQGVEVELEPAAPPQFPAVPGDHGSDSCETATPLELEDGTDGDQMTVNDMTVSESDPILPCMYGRPLNPRGNRTVWYRFVPPTSGHLVAFTDFLPAHYDDSYDTVLALFESPDGTCATLNMLACNDDYSGFFSQVSQFVIEGRTYYIEVADWHVSSQQAATLRLAVILDEGPSFWERQDWDTAGEIWLPRTRHMVVSDGTYIYIIAGETAVTPFPNRDGNMRRFHPATGEWLELYPMPGLDDNHGYSRTSGAYVNGRIYVPSGYVGNNSAYAGTHYTYDIATNSWSDTAAAPVPWATASPSGQPYAWAEAVAAPPREGYYLTGGLLSGDPDPSAPSDAEPTSRLLFYDIAARNWITNLPDMDRARYAHVGALLQTPRGLEVCVAGGVGKVDETTAAALSTTECYNVNSGTWSYRAPLNFARFAADSAVGPDGRWYVYGGINASLAAVAHTEVYDPLLDTWQVLDSRYNIKDPARALAQGAFVGSDLWIFGGEMWGSVVDGQRQILVVPLLQRLFLPHRNNFMPFFLHETISVEPNDVLADAWPIALNQPQRHDFSGQEDFFDIYRWTIAAPGRYEVVVSNIPANSNYDVYLYDDNKFLVGYGTAVGNQTERAITLPIVPGKTYFAVVVRVFGEPTTERYEIVVRPYTP